MLGCLEFEQDELQQALTYFMHAAIGGSKISLDMLRMFRDEGMLNEDVFDTIEREHDGYLALEWSEERESYEQRKQNELNEIRGRKCARVAGYE